MFFLSVLDPVRTAEGVIRRWQKQGQWQEYLNIYAEAPKYQIQGGQYRGMAKPTDAPGDPMAVQDVVDDHTLAIEAVVHRVLGTSYTMANPQAARCFVVDVLAEVSILYTFYILLQMIIKSSIITTSFECCV